MQLFKKFLFPILCGVGYGVTVRISFSIDAFKDMFGVMTIAFIFFVPFIIGLITVYQGDENQRKNWNYIIGMPVLNSLICFLIALAFGWEGLICFIMALPIYCFIALMGGVFMWIYFKYTNQNQVHSFAIILVLFSPIYVSLIENKFELPTEIRKVETSIIINSKPEIVWKHIIKIPKIVETQEGFFYKMGFPKPVEATLSREGIGGVREAKFEKGLEFIETINIWDENQKIGFEIKADPNNTPLTTLDEHVVVGGKYFDALYGEYEIVKISENQINLLLHSKYRLSTRFNFYASLWGDFLMRDIQSNILKVIKSRVEKN